MPAAIDFQTRIMTATHHLRGVALRALAVLALALAFAAPAAAQNVTTTGDIRGRTLDQAGNPIPGVLVTARNQETGLERSAVSAENGIFVLRLLPPGPYTASAEALGYATRSFENIQVSIGQSAAVNFELAEQAVELEALVVTGEAAPIDVADASVTQLVTAQQIEELPALGRDFTDFIALSPQVTLDQGETTGGQFSIGGQAATQTSLQIDGVDANNSFFGENRGGARIPFVFSLESIEQFQIITNGYDVEYGNYSGGIVNVVTRSGTNEFDGTVYANYRSDALTGRGFHLDDTVGVAEYEVQQFAGRFSGPIIRDKAFFLVSGDVQRRREPQFPFTMSLFEPEGEIDPTGEAADDVARFFQILEDVYGIPNPERGYAPFQTTNDVISLFGRVDWNITDEHRLSVRHNYTTYENHNEYSPGFDEYLGRSRAENLEDHSHSFVTELSSVLSDNMFNVFRFQYASEERPRMGNELRPALIVNDIGGTGEAIGYGGTFVSFHNNLEESKLQFIDNFTFVTGDHSIKVGANLLMTDEFNEFLPALSGNCGRGSQGGGVFCFDNLDDFEAGVASSYQWNVQEVGARPRVPTADFGVTELAFYIQDEWAVTPQLTVTAGLRHDRQWFSDVPSRVFDIERAFGFPSATAPRDDNNISPRLSVAYDINGDGNSVVRAGAGYFFGRVPYVLGGNVLGSQQPVFNLTCSGDIGDPDAPPSPLGYGDWDPQGFDNPTSCQGVTQASGVPSYSVWHPDFEYPETFKANVGYEGFVREDTRVSLDLVYSRSTKMFTVRNLNLRDVEFTLDSEDGRQVYTPAAIFNPGAANTLGSRLFTDVGDVFANYNDGRATSLAATVEAQHNVNEDLRFTGAYTYTRAFDNGTIHCCTASGMFADPIIGAFGPNDLGSFGDEDRGWGPTDFVRNHAFVFSGFMDLPYGFQVAAFWRLQSGRPYTAAVSGDLNGDGVRFNDRPYIFAVDELPLGAPDGSEEEFEQRQAYAALLANNECIGDYVGQIVPRNSCRTPWTNLLDMRITKVFETFGDDRAELQLDLFNVVNGIGQLFCSDEEFKADPTEGTCGWGRITTVSGSNTNVYFVDRYDPDTNRVLYNVGQNFGREGFLGANLLLQFQMQLGFKYYF